MYLYEKNIEIFLEKIKWKPKVILNAVSFRLQAFVKPTMYKYFIKIYQNTISFYFFEEKIIVFSYIYIELWKRFDI